MEKTDKSAEDYWFDFSNHGTQMITEANFKAAIRACQKDSAAQQLLEHKEVIKELLPYVEHKIKMSTCIGYSYEKGKSIIDRAKALLQGSNQGQPLQE